MATLPLLFLSNLTLYLLLVYKEDFITPTMRTNLIMTKEATEKILLLFLLPLGGLLLVSNLMYYKVITAHQNPSSNYYSSTYIYNQLYDDCL